MVTPRAGRACSVVLIVLGALALLGCATTPTAVAPPKQAPTQAHERPDKLEIVGLAKSRRFHDLERRLSAMQIAFENGTLSEARVYAAFGAFAHADPALERPLTEWIRLYPDSYAAQLARGIYFKHLGLVVRGEAWARRTAPRRFELMHRYFRRALADLTSALSTNARLAPAYGALISVYGTSGRFDRAKTVFRRAQKHMKNARGPLVTLAHYAQPKWSGNRAELEAVLKRAEDPNNRDRRYTVLTGYRDYARAGELRMRRKFDEAAPYYDRAIRKNANASWYFHGRGRNNWLRDHDDAALKDLARALELGDRNADIWALMADIYMRRKAFDPSLDHVGKAIALDPYNPAYLILRAQILRHMMTRDKGYDDLGLTREDLERASFYGDYDPRLHAEWAQYYGFRRNPSKAKNAWRRAVELAPYSQRYLRHYLVASTSSHDCGGVGATVRYLALCLRNGKCGGREVMSFSYQVNGLIHQAKCPYEPHHVAKRFRSVLSEKHRKAIARNDFYNRHDDEPVIAGRTNVRAITSEGLKLGMTIDQVRRIYPGVKMRQTYVGKDKKVLFVAAGTARSHDGKRKVSVMFSTFGTVHTVHSVGERTLEGAPRELSRKMHALRESLARPYGMPDHAETHERNGKHLITYRQSGRGRRGGAEFMIEQTPPEIRRKRGDNVAYTFKVHRMLIDHELIRRSKQVTDRATAPPDKKPG